LDQIFNHNNSYLPTEQNNINIVTIKKPILQSQVSINNFVDRISLTGQNECKLLFVQAVYQCGLFYSFSEIQLVNPKFEITKP
jgi:hypothetical protein